MRQGSELRPLLRGSSATTRRPRGGRGPLRRREGVLSLFLRGIPVPDRYLDPALVRCERSDTVTPEPACQRPEGQLTRPQPSLPPASMGVALAQRDGHGAAHSVSFCRTRITCSLYVPDSSTRSAIVRTQAKHRPKSFCTEPSCRPHRLGQAHRISPHTRHVARGRHSLGVTAGPSTRPAPRRGGRRLARKNRSSPSPGAPRLAWGQASASPLKSCPSNNG